MIPDGTLFNPKESKKSLGKQEIHEKTIQERNEKPIVKPLIEFLKVNLRR